MTLRRAAIALLALASIGGAAWATATGRASIAGIEAWLASLGPAGPALFIAAFVGGALIGLPGMAFVIGGRLAFGGAAGFALAYAAGVLACLVPFAMARRLRAAGAAATGAAAWQPRNRHVRRAFEAIEVRPLRAVIALRLVLWFNPPLSYALALTPIRHRAYAAACAIALAPVVALAVVATGWFA